MISATNGNIKVRKRLLKGGIFNGVTFGFRNKCRRMFHNFVVKMKKSEVTRGVILKRSYLGKQEEQKESPWT